MRTIQLSRRLRLGGLVAACASVTALAGCANFTEVKADERDVFMVSATGVSYTMSIPALTDAAKEKADDFCAKRNMSADMRQLVRGWRPMQVDLYFRCQTKGSDLRASLK